MALTLATDLLPRGHEARAFKLTVQGRFIGPKPWRIVWRDNGCYNIEARVALADDSTGITPRFKTRKAAITWCLDRGYSVAHTAGAGWKVHTPKDGSYGPVLWKHAHATAATLCQRPKGENEI